MISRHLQVIYCDDIRQEIGNKLSFMGVYDKSLHPAAFPAEIQKLFLRIIVAAPQDNRFEKAVVKVMLDDKVIAETPDLVQDSIYQNQLEAAGNPNQRDCGPDAPNISMFAVIFMLPPFRVEKPAMLRVKVETEDGELRAAALHICPSETAAIGRSMASE